MKYILWILFFVIGFSPMATSQEENLLIPNGDLQIGGTFLGAESASNPLVIFLSGSGAQDRDETILGFKPFKIIADHLAENGISSFRFDDRQVGESTGNLAEATIDDMTEDVQVIMDYFEENEAHTFNEFIVLGHSQGGMVAASTAEKDDRVKGVVFWATPTVPLKDVITDQIKTIQLALGKTESDLEATLEFQEKAYEAVRTDTGWDSLRADFKQLIETELAKLPEAQRGYITDVDAFANAQFDAQVRPINSPHMRSFLFYDTMRAMAKTNVPSLALFGEKDIQVSVDLNGTAYQFSCEENALNCTYKTFADANHLFQKAITGMPDEYGALPPEFVPGFLEEISGWIEGF